MDLKSQIELAKKGALRIASIDGNSKNKVLERISKAINENREEIITENKKDLKEAEKIGLSGAIIKRLKVDNKKIDEMVKGIESVIDLDDPVGNILMITQLDDSLELQKITTPIGVIGVVFESRPDALVQISTLCIKSGNAVILKGGSEAINSNRILFDLIKNAVETDDRFKDIMQLVETRQDVNDLLKLDDYIDLMIPRGSNALVKYIKGNTKIPVLGHADGVCHLYVDGDADLDVALSVSFDSKCQYAAVCNAIETLLVHRSIASEFLPKMKELFDQENVELRGDPEVCEIIKANEATDDDWTTEYNDMVLSIKVVGSVEEAIEHINRYGSHHTDAIVTRNEAVSRLFLDNVDSSSVMYNCSTRFADGYRYGLGSEVGISTSKIHSRGPVGLEGLVIYKYKLFGAGQIVADYAEGRSNFTHKRIL
ncbi:MAG: glutamate-5-semialdehyde dehydrogenase [Halobacteriota archaeon]|nr:glutamate-5-semialdehyde dehydrogenase [Halobacteriota archaeon]